MKHKLHLFSARYCPFCVKVEQVLRKHNISIETTHLEEAPQARVELMEQGGKSQVPCLKINNTYLYESDDIIDWVTEHLTLKPNHA